MGVGLIRMVPTKLRMGSTHTHTQCEYSNKSMDCSQLAAIPMGPIFSSPHTHNLYCERLTFESLFLSLLFYTQLLLWMADIWDYFCHYILHTTSLVNRWHLRLMFVTIFYTQLLLWNCLTFWDYVCHCTIHQEQSMGNQWRKNIKKKESNSVAIYVLPCASLMLMVDLHSFCLSFAVPSSILNHYNGWPRKDQTCPVSCDLFPFSCNRHVRRLRISLSRPSRFVLHAIINLLSLFFFYFLATTDDGCVAHCLSVCLCSSSVCGSVCFCLMGVV